MNLVATPHMDFPHYALMLAKAGGDTFQAVEVAKHDLRGLRPRVEMVLRSAVEAGTTSDPTWAGSLADHQQMVVAWAEGLRSMSPFDALLPLARPVPLDRSVVVVTSVATASVSAEAALKPITKLALDGNGVAPQKAVAIVVVTDDLLRFASPIATALINGELRAGVAAATNLAFLAGLADGIAPINSTDDPLADLRAALAVVAANGGARPHWVVDPALAVQLATYSVNGAPAFPAMTANGGVVAGVPVLVSDQLPADSLGSLSIVVDASQLAMASETITLRASSFAALAMDDSPSPGAQNLVSMFQTNSTAILAERRFGSQRLRDGAVVVISGAEYIAP